MDFFKMYGVSIFVNAEAVINQIGSIIAIGGLIFVGIVSFIAIIVGAIISAMAVAFWILQNVTLAFKKASEVRYYENPPSVSEKSSPASSIEEISEE